MITKFKLYENNISQWEYGIELLKELKFEEFLENIDINLTNKKGYNYLFVAAILDKNNLVVIKFLIDNGININHIRDHMFGNEFNILIFISKKLNLTQTIAEHRRNMFKKMIMLLIEAGADWNFLDSGGKSFLDFIIIKNRDFFKEIIEKYPEKYENYLTMKKANEFNL